MRSTIISQRDTVVIGRTARNGKNKRANSKREMATGFKKVKASRHKGMSAAVDSRPPPPPWGCNVGVTIESQERYKKL